MSPCGRPETIHLDGCRNRAHVINSIQKKKLFSFIGPLILCHEQLGVESGDLVDSQLTASTDMMNGTAIPHWRLNQPASAGIPGGWLPSTSNSKPWLQVLLYRETSVTGVVVQGREDADMWVTTYKVKTSTHGYNWNAVFLGDVEEVCSHYFKVYSVTA